MTEQQSRPQISSGIQQIPGILRARKMALAILDDVLLRSKPLDMAIEGHQAFLSLPGKDRAFVRMLTATTMRRLGQIDDFISRAMDRAERPEPPALYNLLRMGTAQIVFMDVPDYAVVDTTVQIAEENGMKRQKGLINAVLRRIAKEFRDWEQVQDEVRCNIPEWLLKSWIQDYDLRTAAEIGQASLSEAPLDITIKDPDMLEYWAGTLHAQILPTETLRRTAGGRITELPGFDDGMWWVQDASAAIPAKLFGDVAGKQVVDLCAAPGGKTMQLAALGAEVLALDRSANRLKRLQDNLKRLRLEDTVQTEAADASVWRPPVPVKFVLLDVPCTATGTIRRHPDILYLKKEQDMERLAVLQARLLENAVEMLAPGGILIYCTCSIQKAESENQIEHLLSSNASMQRVPVSAAELGGLDILLTTEGDVRILPFHQAAHGGMDGFYISRLQKM